MTAQQKKIVVLTGAGMSAESGFATFRDSGGLWETHPVEQVATPEGWQRDPNFVNEFYNGLRRQLVEARPNRGHELLAELENDFDVRIVTQNVDDLHERAGSSQVLHLHGELMKACSSRDPNNPFHIVTLAPPHLDSVPGQKAGDGSLLRPYIVWFGESVPLIERAAEWGAAADADLDRVNLAGELTDGMQLYVPRRGETAAPAPIQPNTAQGGAQGTSQRGGSQPQRTLTPSGGTGTSTASAPVNINTATAEQLQSLPRIGPAMAQRIIAWREAHGGFRSVDELDAVPGIGPTLLETLRPLVTV